MGLLTKIFGGGDGSAPDTERAKEGGVNGAAHARPALPAERKSGPVPRAYEPAPKSHPAAAVEHPRQHGNPGAGIDPLRRRAPLIGAPSTLTMQEFPVQAGRPSSMTLPLGFSLDGAARADAAQSARPEPRPSEPPELLPPRLESDIVALDPSAPRAPSSDAPAALAEPEPVRMEAAQPAAPEPLDDSSGAETERPLELLVDLAQRLALGPVSDEWLTAGTAAAHALKLAACGGWQPHLLASFESLERLLAEGARIRALPLLWRLSDSVPEWPAPARSLRDSSRARERRIANELLASVDGLRLRGRQLFAAEKTLSHLVGSTPELLAEELDTPIERAQELARRVASYEAERRARPIDIGHETALREAVIELDRRQRQFDASDESARAARQERRDALLRVNLVLAERGDLALLDELEPMAVAERVERLSVLIGLGVGERA
ncbi:MAG TPA: hypothetical protein VFS67_23275 [Polyangiaceae bacterium]|nr:hypothetical protein [Polyangiaceae bacterium]